MAEIFKKLKNMVGRGRGEKKSLTLRRENIIFGGVVGVLLLLFLIILWDVYTLYKVATRDVVILSSSSPLKTVSLSAAEIDHLIGLLNERQKEFDELVGKLNVGN